MRPGAGVALRCPAPPLPPLPAAAGRRGGRLLPPLLSLLWTPLSHHPLIKNSQRRKRRGGIRVGVEAPCPPQSFGRTARFLLARRQRPHEEEDDDGGGGRGEGAPTTTTSGGGRGKGREAPTRPARRPPAARRLASCSHDDADDDDDGGGPSLRFPPLGGRASPGYRVDGPHALALWRAFATLGHGYGLMFSPRGGAAVRWHPGPLPYPSEPWAWGPVKAKSASPVLQFASLIRKYPQVAFATRMPNWRFAHGNQLFAPTARRFRVVRPQFRDTHCGQSRHVRPRGRRCNHDFGQQRYLPNGVRRKYHAGHQNQGHRQRDQLRPQRPGASDPCIRPVDLANAGRRGSDKTALGLNIRDPVNTPIPAPSTAPVISIIAASPGVLTMTYRDAMSAPKVKAKPFGSTQVLLYALFGTVAPPTPGRNTLRSGVH